ncbi:hypothetical protein OESDEN_10904 [Oesophagostomum dentatum]|uniref:Uncharacterized protein n=1 Tax=Oesophagostomum dentatum TaxID=61180 RepID=A0A0B1SZE2_OESDE|nr:hypothetical protein OESDEN_10904 [Oesophagostomum dentatum]
MPSLAPFITFSIPSLRHKWDRRSQYLYSPRNMYKVVTKIIARRVEKHIKDTSILPNEQAEFRKGYSTLDWKKASIWRF